MFSKILENLGLFKIMMATSIESHVGDLEVEIIVGSYEHVLFGYTLMLVNDKAVLNLSFTDKSHCASVRAVAVSNQRLLASGSADETIQLFDLKTRHEAGTLMKHDGTITGLEFFEDFMISADESGMICIWKILGRSYECMKTLTGHKGAVTSLSIHPSGKLLLSVGQDKTIRTWNLITGKRAYTTNTKSLVDIVKWTNDGEKYVLCYNRVLDICSVSKAGPIHSTALPGKGHSLDFVSDNVLVIGCEGGLLVFVNLDDGSIMHELKVECNRIKSVSCSSLDSSKSLLSLITNEGVIELHLVTTGDESISAELIAATKTLLRPVCMRMVANSEPSETVEVNKRL